MLTAFATFGVVENLFNLGECCGHYLQRGYYVLQEACLGGHLDLAQMLIEEFKCPLMYLYRSPPTPTFERKNLDWLGGDNVLKERERATGLSEQQRAFFYRQIGNDEAMITYLEEIFVVQSRDGDRNLPLSARVITAKNTTPSVQIPVSQQSYQGVQPSRF